LRGTGFGCGDGKDSVGTFFNVLHLFAGAAFEIRPLHHLYPERHQVYFRAFSLLEFPVHWEFNRAGHNRLLARIFCYRPTDFGLLNRDVVQFFSMARSDAISPAGPAPTIKTSATSGAGAEALAAASLASIVSVPVKLGNQGNRKLPLLTIALDCGFHLKRIC
jgi:hypothetical protein